VPEAEKPVLSAKGKAVHLACGDTDMRKAIDGLSLLVQGSFALDPFGEALFVFCNKRRDRLKILEWDGNGFWLHSKRLERGRFRWPAADAEKTMTLSERELAHLLESPGLEAKLRRKTIRERVLL
jgi:transposase